MKPREAKPVRSQYCCGQDLVTVLLLFSSGRLENPFLQEPVPISPVPALSAGQLWFGGGARGTGPILISLARFLCVVEWGAVVEGQKKPGARLEAGNCLEAFRGGKAGLPARHGGVTCLSCVPGPRPDPSGCSQNLPPSSGRRRELQAGSGDQGTALPCRHGVPSRSGAGQGDPQKVPILAGQPPMTPPGSSVSPPRCVTALSLSQLPTSSDSRPRTKCRSSPLPSRASTHLT